MNKLWQIINKTIKGIIIFLLIILFVASIQYYHTEIYNFNDIRPFSGSDIYNPYKNYNGKNLKANFHTHSKAYNNLTNGAQEADEVINHYLNNGYDIISLSDYNKISFDNSPNYITTYEHGLNFGKRHQLVINSDYVRHFDFSLLQNKHHKQQVIKKIKHNEALVALAHPKLWDGYSTNDMKYLRGVDLIEIKNHYKSSTQIWDDALSAGNLMWALSDDDCHDIHKEYYTFVNWNRIGVKDNNKQKVLSALKEGNHYAVSNKKHIETNSLDSCILKGNTISVYFAEEADLISFIGDYGIIKLEVENSNTASYGFKPEDTYIRIEAKTGSCEIYLNPLVRYNGNVLKKASVYPAVNPYLTILYRIMILFFNSLIIIIILMLNGNLSVRIRGYKTQLKLKFPRFAINKN